MTPSALVFIADVERPKSREVLEGTLGHTLYTRAIEACKGGRGRFVGVQAERSGARTVLPIIGPAELLAVHRSLLEEADRGFLEIRYVELAPETLEALHRDREVREVLRNAEAAGHG